METRLTVEQLEERMRKASDFDLVFAFELELQKKERKNLRQASFEETKEIMENIDLLRKEIKRRMAK